MSVHLILRNLEIKIGAVSAIESHGERATLDHNHLETLITDSE